MTGPDDFAETEPAPLAKVETTEVSLDDAHSRYERVELIGRGGMGEVELCRDQRIGREIAVKVIRAGRGSLADARARFLREARVQGQLEHPAIVPVYDIGQREDGEVYFTMKRVRGRSLSELIDERRPDGTTPRRLLDAFSRVCQAVHFAHERGVLHRDLKPDNLMLGDYGEVYVLDWGLAKVVGTDDEPELAPVVSGDGAEGETEVGAVLGTPGYIAPEQLEGAAEPRSDVYALGAILFEILTGQRLHDGAGVQQRLVSTIDGVDARPSVRAPEVAVAPELEAICVRATAQSPDDRFASVGELAERLERYLDGDRDAELRTRSADAHAEAARAAAERAVEGDDAQREVALREIGRALGLIPQHPVAVRCLAELLETPPREVPAPAERAAEELAREQTEASARRGVFAYFSWFWFAPLLWWIGFRDTRWFWVTTVAMLIAGSFTIYIVMSRKFHLERTACTLGTLAMSTLFTLFGAWVLLPGSLLVHMMAFGLSPKAACRRHAFIVTMAATVLLFAASVAELVPATLAVDTHAIRVLPVMVEYDPTIIPWLLLAAHLIIIVTAATFVGSIRGALSRAERELQVRAWHLRQMFAS